MAITAAMVKELREITGAGMLDCKNVLVEVNGDITKAIDVLREKGLAKAAKKSGRIAAEGLVMQMVSADNKTAALIEVNSETDFVAKNEKFVTFVKDLAKVVLDTQVRTVEALKALPYPGEADKTVDQVLTENIATIGENLSIRRIAIMGTTGTIASYTHGGGKIVVLVDVDNTDTKAEEVGKNVAMQIAALNPEYISMSDVSDETKSKEREILLVQAMNENQELPEGKRKPEKIIAGIVEGRLNKNLKSFCLLEQDYVKDPSLTVAKYVKEELGSDKVIKSFIRFETGEGLEKKDENFAEEVAKQLQN
ncbi:translation elongation factor Ts [Candidatus Epulonipiscium viviparus]|uniref:translation elongation factor Ts n=1 Tax=Candidatus Epulonipiscium viviparus TaxID=420336 RepID=UPI00016BFCC5|nr:translation elongation factor Ts [Candidatus Epulopiscium viviparus]